MKKVLPILATLLLAGCLATENRKVEITMRGIAPTTSNTPWWRTPYYADRPLDNEWDKFIPHQDLPDRLHSPNAIDAEVEFWQRNAIKWPKTMRPAYNPKPIWVTPAPKKKVSADLEKRLSEPVLPPTESEVY